MIFIVIRNISICNLITDSYLIDPTSENQY